MPRKKELPAPDSGEQDDLLSTEPQESPNAPLTEPINVFWAGHIMKISFRDDYIAAAATCQYYLKINEIFY